MTKMTYVTALDNALAVVTDEATRERLEALKASIQKRNASKADKHYLTKEQKAALALTEEVYEVMEVGKAYSRDAVFALFPENVTTVGKVGAALIRLVSDGRVERSEDHRKVFYTRKGE